MELEFLEEYKVKELETILGSVQSKQDLYELASVDINLKQITPSYAVLSFNYSLAGVNTGSSGGRLHSKNKDYVGDLWQGDKKNIFVPERFSPTHLIKSDTARGLGSIFLSRRIKALFNYDAAIKDYLFVPNALTPRGVIFYERLGLNSDLMLEGEYSCADVANKIVDYASKRNFKVNL